VSRRRGAALLEVLLAVALLAGALWCWHRGVQTTLFPPYTRGAAAQLVTYYSAPWISGAVTCAVVAGLLAVDTVRNYRLAAGASVVQPAATDAGTAQR